MATYEREQEKSPSAHTLYNLYEEARVISNQKTLVARRVIQRDLRARLSLPGTLIDDYVRVIDERCASSAHQKVWRRRPNASRMDTMINQALNLAIKRALPRSIPKGIRGCEAPKPKEELRDGHVSRRIGDGAHRQKRTACDAVPLHHHQLPHRRMLTPKNQKLVRFEVIKKFNTGVNLIAVST